MVRVLAGKDLPRADPDRVYLLRSFGNSGHQVYDVTDPVNPVRLVEVDDRGYIYIVDRANTGLHILELTGGARSIANFAETSQQ